MEPMQRSQFINTALVSHSGWIGRKSPTRVTALQLAPLVTATHRALILIFRAVALAGQKPKAFVKHTASVCPPKRNGSGQHVARMVSFTRGAISLKWIKPW